MKWSPEQDRALCGVRDWIREPKQQVYRLFGFAGVGKSELARHFASGVDGHVQFMAFTGKAAQVMRERGCGNACTIHSLIYRAKDKSRAKLRELEEALARERSDAKCRALRKEIEAERAALAQPSFSLNTDSEFRGAALGIVDECSMVDGRVGEDLLSFGVPLLVLGDPGQLPPVFGAGFFTNCKPDFMLEEIHRQARDNPIIAMANAVRLGKKLPRGEDYGESRVVSRKEIASDPEAVLGYDQVLCGRNATRRGGNARYRELQGRTGAFPEAGEKLVCLRNNYQEGLLNGTLWRVEDVGDADTQRVFLSLSPEDSSGHSIAVEAHAHHFLGTEDTLSWVEKREANELTYGYLLTVHKAQGSQWGSVLLFDESRCFRKDAKRWLYTGITRAANKVTIVQD